MNIYGLIIAGMTLVSLGIHIAKHGESRSGEIYNGWTYAVATVVTFWLYWMAGIFNV